MTPILGESQVTLQRARAWAKAHGATDEFVGIAQHYWWNCPSRGVRPEVAYAQVAISSCWGQDLKDKNPGRLSREFPTWSMGATAHMDHLAVRAGSPGYPKVDTADPDHSSTTWVASSVEELPQGERIVWALDEMLHGWEEM